MTVAQKSILYVGALFIAAVLALAIGLSDLSVSVKLVLAAVINAALIGIFYWLVSKAPPGGVRSWPTRDLDNLWADASPDARNLIADLTERVRLGIPVYTSGADGEMVQLWPRPDAPTHPEPVEDSRPARSRIDEGEDF